ncbi:MAG: uracil-DNA glycosylase [Desulfarculus sp.]|nr:uracil-DNA glycosylase [Desulfarculus sp.]
MADSPPDCLRCRHLSITWERGRAYACRAMGFKSGQIPWRVVLASSGQPCLSFAPRTRRDPGSQPTD